MTEGPGMTQGGGRDDGGVANEGVTAGDVGIGWQRTRSVLTFIYD